MPDLVHLFTHRENGHTLLREWMQEARERGIHKKSKQNACCFFFLTYTIRFTTRLCFEDERTFLCLLLFTFFSLLRFLLHHLHLLCCCLATYVLHKIRFDSGFFFVQCFVYTFLQFVYIRFVWSIFCLYTYFSIHTLLFIDDVSGVVMMTMMMLLLLLLCFIYLLLLMFLFIQRSHKLCF